MIESGEPRDIHHMATLIGYGAAAINPYLMFESLDELADRSLLPEDLEREEAEQRIVKAIGKGLLKTISKMGISTIQSYCGAQIFEAVGLEPELIDTALHRHRVADRRGRPGACSPPRRWSATSAPTRAPGARCCPSAASCSGAVTASSTSGTRTPSPTCSTRCAAARTATARAQTYERVRAAANDESARKAALRGLMRFRFAERADPAGGGRVGGRDRQALHAPGR